MMGWRCWCARAWGKTRSVVVCMSFATADGIGSRSSSGKRGDIGYAPVGLRKGLFGGRKRKEPARATDARNFCCFLEETALKQTKERSGIGARPKRNRLPAG